MLDVGSNYAQAKDILYHLYKTAVGNLQRLMPKEIRILKYLLTIKDPEELLHAMRDAFTPGVELEGKDVDCLYTFLGLELGVRTVRLMAEADSAPGTYRRRRSASGGTHVA
ncbi:hypothetical protein BHE74_00015272 [Ensete ventricosum]|nr:hypothetical protein GW17_00052671 [Ensete ventricosum]RWW76631.1 hypothetical protein BHE74_00015272 [Ensete ventricosum]RZS10996.1 hypothetical protein BHM03_00042278 [Ensete ventricosum]